MNKESLLKVLAAHPDNRICEFWRGKTRQNSHMEYNVTLVEHSDFYFYTKEISSFIRKSLVLEIKDQLVEEHWGEEDGIGGVTYKLRRV